MTNSEIQQAVQFLAVRCDGAFKHDGQGFDTATFSIMRELMAALTKDEEAIA